MVKFNKILIFFGAALPVSIALRLFQLLYTVELSTGFFKQEEKTVGMSLLVLIALFCVITAVLARMSVRSRELPPGKSVYLAVASFLTAGVLGHELVSESFSGTVLAWQLTLLGVMGTLAVLFFFAYGVSLLAAFRLPPITFAVPALYFVIRIICAFTSISSLALISDNILLMAFYCFGLLFFLNFGKLYNGIDRERNFRKLLASGLCFVLLGFGVSVPYLIVNAAFDGTYRHTSSAANLSALALGIFAAAFLFAHFSNREKAERET